MDATFNRRFRKSQPDWSIRGKNNQERKATPEMCNSIQWHITGPEWKTYLKTQWELSKLITDVNPVRRLTEQQAGYIPKLAKEKEKTFHSIFKILKGNKRKTFFGTDTSNWWLKEESLLGKNSVVGRATFRERRRNGIFRQTQRERETLEAFGALMVTPTTSLKFTPSPDEVHTAQEGASREKSY